MRFLEVSRRYLWQIAFSAVIVVVAAMARAWPVVIGMAWMWTMVLVLNSSQPTRRLIAGCSDVAAWFVVFGLIYVSLGEALGGGIVLAVGFSRIALSDRVHAQVKKS